VGELRDRDYIALARFRYALRVFERFSEQAARSHGVTPSQHQLLLAIRGYPFVGPPAISGVAELLQQHVHSVVELVDRAAEAGLVKKAPDPKDRRRQLLRVTKAGERLLESLSADHREELRRSRRQLADVLAALD
jgi:DNA-binding MarR family transcriptional regulator